MKIGIIHGIHEDINSLKEALRVLEKKKCNTLVCVGDITGYSIPYFGFFDSRNAHECVKLVRKHCDIVIAGNHDLHLVKKNPDNSPFNYPENWYSLPLIERQKLSKGKLHLMDSDLEPSLDKKDVNWLRKLPEHKIIKGKQNILLSHFGYPNLVGDSIEKKLTAQRSKKHLNFMKEHNCQIGICGHDLVNGATICTENQILNKGFGKHKIPNQPFWFFSPWVGEGTNKNGVSILDLDKRVIEVIPLSAKKHKIPKVFS